jgi:hypothetical protein
MLQHHMHGREHPMDILLTLNHVPIIRFPSYSEALAAVAGYLAMGYPVESIHLTQWHDGKPPNDARCQKRPSGASPEGGSVYAY